MEVLSTTLAYSGADKIVKKLKEISGGKILDVGTGYGEFIGFLKQALQSFASEEISRKKNRFRKN